MLCYEVLTDLMLDGHEPTAALDFMDVGVKAYFFSWHTGKCNIAYDDMNYFVHLSLTMYENHEYYIFIEGHKAF